MRKRSGALAVVALSIAVPGIFHVSEAASQTGPRFSENYRLTSDTPSRTRDVPGLTSNPANPDHIVEVDINPTNLQCDFHTSFDGGRTWKGGHLTIKPGNENPPWPTPACSPNFDAGGYAHLNTGIVFGTGQNVYVAFSSQRGAFTRLDTSPLTLGGPGDDVLVARSTDGGRTFQPATVAIPGGDPNPQPVSTRPQLAVDRGAGTGGQDRLYVNAWQLHIAPNGGGPRRMLVARSDTAGATWGPTVVASRVNVRSGADATTAETTDEVVRELGQPVVGPDHAVYAVYRNRDPAVGGTTCAANPLSSGQTRSCIVVARSTDLGQTWQQFSTGVPLPVGSGGQPKLAIDPSTPAGVGTLYVAFHGQLTGGDTADIMVQKSVDRAATWTPNPPVRVNSDPTGNVQAFPAISVSPQGRVDVIWFDRRHPYPGTTRLGDIYMASSTNGATSFGANRRVTDRTFNRDVGFDSQLGGYGFYGPESEPLGGGRGIAAWTDSREGDFDDGVQDIYLSRFDTAGALGKSAIATATPSGLSVRLSRLAYPGGAEALGPDPVTKVVVANQDDLPAALAGSVLARAGWGPLLLSPAASLPAAVRADIARIRPQGAYVLGATSSLSSAVSSSVKGATRDGENVQRVESPPSVATANRSADLAARVAELMRPLPGANPEAVIVNPKTPEAAAAAALAAAQKLPILFVDERTAIPPPTSAAITSLGIKKLLIVGGTSSVNATVETALTTAVGGAPNIKRVGGANPSEVSENVAQEARLRGLPSNLVYVADGARPVEGAALGAAVGRLNGLMLFAANASTATAETRVSALGFEPAVDRIVGARGTGGSDPAVPATPRAPTPAAYPLPPGNVRLAGCPGSSTNKNLIVLTNGNDTRNGTAAADLIFAGAGNDVVDALGGDDCADLGPGNDRGQGGSGDDFVQAGIGNDVVSGGTGKDNLRGFTGNDRLSGNGGDDLIVGGIGRDRISGASGNDRLNGESSADRIGGGSGRDRISGGASSDRLQGDGGNDRITGGGGGDRISAGSGADRIAAVDGERDRINCGSGTDRVTADREDRVSRNCERVRRI